MPESACWIAAGVVGLAVAVAGAGIFRRCHRNPDREYRLEDDEAEDLRKRSRR